MKRHPCGHIGYLEGNRCKECYNTYMRIYLAKRYSDRRQMAIEMLGSRCVQCESVEDLEFDHIDRSQKSFDVSRIWLGRFDRLKQEIEKCQLLCSSCHQEKTSHEMGVPHGGGVKGKRLCKCDLCKAKAREYAKKLKYSAKLKRRCG